MKTRRLSLLAAISLFSVCVVPAQGQYPFDLESYKQFLASHQDLTSEQLRSLYPAGSFTMNVRANFPAAQYSDSIDKYYHLTADEKSLINEHGFMVTERLRYKTFGDAFVQVYYKDLPAFVSTDAILHAIHMSYDEILKDMEVDVLIGKVDSLLGRLHSQLPALAARYASHPGMHQSLADLDIYLTVPGRLLGKTVAPVFAENDSLVAVMLDAVKAQNPQQYPLFSSTARWIDFSQFTPRGHYTQSPALTQYFQAMIWLGRIELYLIAPQNVFPVQTDQDIQRQTIDAVLLNEAVESAQAFPLLEQIDRDIRLFVGESDNVTLPNIRSLVEATSLDSASALLSVPRWKAFQDTLKQKSFAFQRINSQILMSSSALVPDKIVPASSFLLLGQRFVIDSYVTGNTVFDNIVFQNRKVWRALPSTLDILFALGNDAAAQLLVPELDRYHYSSNLSALRYLVDSYDAEFWQSSLYNGWLNSIRTLKPPSERTALPGFMQTAAWWQEKMNTQLASWAELRHDNLLYAKQSYTGGNTCSFPESYVEPLPEFYDAVRAFASSGVATFTSLSRPTAVSYFSTLAGVADTLGSIARKELSMTPLSIAEKNFLRSMLSAYSLCGWLYDGWYFHLYYSSNKGFEKQDLVVADVHTCPTDEFGNMVGWVLHGGTGPVNIAVVTATVPDGRTIAFIGPVMSYYEYVSTNFKRLTDEEWVHMYATAPSFRPSLVNLYLADTTGSLHGEGPSLVTGVDQKSPPGSLPTTLVLGQNFPNPFNSSTIITFTIPASAANTRAELAVYDVQGRLVKRLLSQEMPAGNYSTRWDGRMEGGTAAASGVYFYHLTAGGQRQIGKMSFIK